MRAGRLALASFAFVVALAPPVGAAPSAQPASLHMETARKAALVQGGEAALIIVTASCPAGEELLESFVYVNQDGNSTEFAPVNVPCDGEIHTVTVLATALDFVLHEGKASASGFMLLASGEGISPVQRIRLK